MNPPPKPRRINKYLGPGYKVLASFGHIRDLPSKDGSVKPDDDFAMTWHVDERAQKRIKDIADAVKDADKLILATDPDREGEAISWHVLEVLRQKKALGKAHVERVVFNAVTKAAVLEAIAHPRADQRGTGRRLSGAPRPRLSGRLHAVAGVVAQAARRALGGARAVGGAAAGLSSAKSRSKRSGRRNIGPSMPNCARRPAASTARLTHLDGKKLDKLSLANEADAKRAVAAIESSRFTVGSVEASRSSAIPAPPFITSTLQQEASRKLGFAAKRTMQVAQQLYEGVDVGGETVGLITYMRTDGVTMDGAADSARRATIDRRALWQEICAAQPARLFQQGQERAGSARGDPPHQLLAHAGYACRAISIPIRRGSTS